MTQRLNANRSFYTSRQDATFDRLQADFTAPYFAGDAAMATWAAALEDSVRREFASKAFSATLPASPVLPASIEANDSASGLVRPGAATAAEASAARARVGRACGTRKRSASRRPCRPNESAAPSRR